MAVKKRLVDYPGADAAAMLALKAERQRINEGLEQAAAKADASADLYAAYAEREKRAAPGASRSSASQHHLRAELFLRDHDTCRELARQIRALKGDA